MGRTAVFAPESADDGAAALVAALAGQGRAFRIGGAGAVAPLPGLFETLTGGSLGAPRRILRRQASWCASFAVNAGLFGIGPGARVAILGRLSHSLALDGAIEGVCLGAEVHLLGGMRPDRQARSLAARGIGVVYATPAQLRQVVEAGVRLPDLRDVIIGGAKLDMALRAGLQGLAGAARVHEFYGAAETSFITLAQDGDDPDSVGRPYPGVEVALRDSKGRDVAPGGQGEVWVKSPYLFEGYVGEDRGAARWHEGWLCVGEVGQWAAGGVLILRGRAGRMVTIADQNVFPEEIERLIEGLPGVARVAVVPVHDVARGSVLVALVQGDAGQEAAILAAMRARLGPMIAPKALIWQQDWPILPSGKTDLAALAKRVPKWR